MEPGRGLLEDADDAVAGAPGKRVEIAFLVLATLVICADPARGPRHSSPRKLTHPVIAEEPSLPSSDFQMAVRDSLRFLGGAGERDEADHNEHRDQRPDDRLGGNRHP